MHKISIQQACKVVHLSRNAYYYEPKLADDSEIIKALKILAEKYPRYGFKKLFKKIRRQGFGLPLFFRTLKLIYLMQRKGYPNETCKSTL